MMPNRVLMTDQKKNPRNLRLSGITLQCRRAMPHFEIERGL